jgi:Arc/MetJ-type ribon-helix-helix transcriptional regulator
MATATKTVSVRLPESLLREAASLRPDAKWSEMVFEAFVAWVERIRRQHEDDLIRQALTSIPDDQKEHERELAGLAGRSSLRTLEKADD